MRHLTWILAVVLLAMLATPAAATDEFRFEGNGWGHGIGMTQFGALEQAKDGRSYKQIISYYYTGAVVGAMPSDVPPNLFIGLRQDTGREYFRPVGGDGNIIFAGGEYTALSGYEYVFQMYKGTCYLQRETSKGSKDFSRVEATAPTCGSWSNPTRVDWTGRLDIRHKSYDLGRGHLRVLDASSGGRFHLAVVLRMDEYLYGLAEVPYSWPTHAVRAQAVAGRSYAAHRMLAVGTSPRSQCGCHLYDSIWDQVYAGWDREQSTYWPNWRDAVNGTSGEVVRADGQKGTIKGVVQAFYSSSSGGKTENIEDAWYQSDPTKALPYLQSVDDPWSLRASNSKAYWTKAIGESTIRSKVGLDRVLSISVTSRNESGSARTVAFHGSKDGKTTTETRSGQWVRTALGLNSTWIKQVFLPPFIDDDGSKHEADIVFIAEKGVTKGCNPPINDRFCPKDNVTREQMSAFLVRARGLSKTSGASFEDVPAGSTFATDIDKLATAGVTKGCNPPTNDRFCPKDDVTREQMAAFLVRAYGLTKTSGIRFSDVPRGSTFELDIDKLATAGITKGCGGDKFCPRDPVTREQMASFLARAIKNHG